MFSGQNKYRFSYVCSGLKTLNHPCFSVALHDMLNHADRNGFDFSGAVEMDNKFYGLESSLRVSLLHLFTLTIFCLKQAMYT